MCDEKLISIRESICGTCLSQDRKLFPVNDSKSLAIFCFELTLTGKDKVCWECRYVILKMAAFRRQALKAQAVLASLLSGVKCEVESLSCLSISTKTLLDAMPSSDEEEVKIEPMNEPMKEEISIPGESEDRSDEVSDGEDIGSPPTTVVSVSSTSVKDAPTTRTRPERKTQIIMPNLYAKQDAEKEKEVGNPDSTYCVEKINEQEMFEWRERKKKMDFYTSSVFKCKKCIEPLESVTLYGAHKKRHTQLFGEIACHICEHRFLDNDALALHMKTHFRLLKCRYCAHEWDSVNSMRRHCSDAHDVPITSWNCDQCGREFLSPQKLSEHGRCHRLLLCPECGKILRSSLKKHMISQHRHLPLRRCSVCSLQFKGDSGLKAHMTKHAKKVDEVTFCMECNMEFRNKYVYRSHMRNTVRHATPKDLRFKCSECGKGFLDNFALTNHVDAMHDKQKKYKCDACGEGFRTVVARRKHIRRSHEGKLPAKDKVCHYCGKAFQSKVFLLQHINSHTGARPYKCKLCDASFGFKSALYLHGRFIHKIQKKTAGEID